MDSTLANQNYIIAKARGYDVDNPLKQIGHILKEVAELLMLLKTTSPNEEVEKNLQICKVDIINSIYYYVGVVHDTHNYKCDTSNLDPYEIADIAIATGVLAVSLNYSLENLVKIKTVENTKRSLPGYNEM